MAYGYRGSGCARIWKTSLHLYFSDAMRGRAGGGGGVLFRSCLCLKGACVTLTCTAPVACSPDGVDGAAPATTDSNEEHRMNAISIARFDCTDSRQCTLRFTGALVYRGESPATICRRQVLTFHQGNSLQPKPVTRRKEQAVRVDKRPQPWPGSSHLRQDRGLLHSVATRFAAVPGHACFRSFHTESVDGRAGQDVFADDYYVWLQQVRQRLAYGPHKDCVWRFSGGRQLVLTETAAPGSCIQFAGPSSKLLDGQYAALT